MSDRILIVASSGGGLNPRGSVEVYVAASLQEAERFVALWNQEELEHAKAGGGYLGNADIISDELPVAADWIAEQEAQLAERAAEDVDANPEDSISNIVFRLLTERRD